MKNINRRTCEKLYLTMLKIRRFEEKICELYARQEMRTPVHLSIGQEAVSAGVCAALAKKDKVFGTHRGHGMYIAKGGDIRSLACELYGKKKGCSAGKGGSMHIIDTKRGVSGTTAIVGGNIPLAVGAALASEMRRSGEISCAFFGDGAVDEGVFYESMNFAALRSLPVIFVCENNLYAVHSHVEQRQPLDNIYERGGPFGLNCVGVDGNDVVEVYKAALEAVSRAREGRGPSLIECRTYRFKTHVGPETDLELGFPPGRYLKEWMKRDPVKLMREKMPELKWYSRQKEKKALSDIDREMKEIFEYAAKQDSPGPEDLMTDVKAMSCKCRESLPKDIRSSGKNRERSKLKRRSSRALD